jgi:outer membrane protein assembly factor BamA
VGGDVFIGLGYHYDDFMDIVDERARNGEPTPFSEYSGSAVGRTRASGASINLLGDSRDNIVNPARGYYLSGTFRDYSTWLGSDQNWQEFLIDLRLYPHLPPQSPNVLAFWLYSWMTFGSGPYLDLPAIGWDTYGRGGRGYLQGRIRSPNQSYAECEYRVQLTRDGLLGAVFFLNLTASTERESGVFARPDRGGGLGLRILFNKRSRTNLAIDRAWGEHGSGGWFLAMTEVF